jgi:pyrimidine-nucleoside phosphorylase
MAEYRALAKNSIDDGQGYRKFLEMIKAEGGDTAYLHHIDEELRRTASYEVKATAAGYIKSMNTEQIGITSVELGAGRLKADDKIDNLAGLVIGKKTGEKVEAGELLATLYVSEQADRIDEKFKNAAARYLRAIEISDEQPADGKRPLILKRIV